MNAPLTLKQKKCKQCKELFLPMRPLQQVCGYECSIKFARALADKNDSVQKKAERKQLREAKLKIKTRQQWLKEVQIVFNRYIRLRDEYCPCISCGRHHGGQYHAGHYLSVGSSPQLRFEESNVHKQCSACNNYLSGNIANFRMALVNKIGLERLDWLEGPHEMKHYSIDDLIELKAHYKLKVKELENDSKH